MFRTTLTAKAPRNLATMARFSYIQKREPQNAALFKISYSFISLVSAYQKKILNSLQITLDLEFSSRSPFNALVS